MSQLLLEPKRKIKNKLQEREGGEEKRGHLERNDGGAENQQRYKSLFTPTHMDLRVTTRCCQRGEARVATQVMDVCLHKLLRDAQ